MKIQLIATWKAYNCDTTKDDMEVETEPNVYEQYEEYVKQVEVKQSDDISAEVDDEKNVDIISKFKIMFIFHHHYNTTTN